MSTPILITLDGNIGAGKSTLLKALEEHIPSISVIQEPVGDWLTMTNGDGESLLALFYKDKKRWSYTFQNCALLTRLLDTKAILDNWKPTPGKLPVVVTERSVLTDRHVFAEMLHNQGIIDELEWNLYMRWFNAFAKDLPVKGIIHVTTSATTSKERIAIRDRKGEGDIQLEYLEALDVAHQRWVESSHLPTLQISTEPGTDVKETAERVFEWIRSLLPSAKE